MNKNDSDIKEDAPEHHKPRRWLAHPDASLWLTWMGIMILAVIALPFIVRQSDVVRALADLCMAGFARLS